MQRFGEHLLRLYVTIFSLKGSKKDFHFYPPAFERHIFFSLLLWRRYLRTLRGDTQRGGDGVVFQGADSREFWKRAEERNKATADLYNKLGLAEYAAMEAFVRWRF